MPKWRIMTWVILAFNILMLIWIIAGVAGVADNCAGKTGVELDACEAGTAVGATIGAGMVVGLWVAGDVILGIIWLVTNRKRTRECPACGRDVKKGLSVCPKCGFNFAAAAGK